MLAALDSNILVYAHVEPDSSKGGAATDILDRAGRHGGVIAAQVLGEFLWVVRRRRRDRYQDALAIVETMPRTIVVPHSDRDRLARAARLSDHHRLQLWDALIVIASADGGATHLLSEDMHDGFAFGGLTIVNPFDPSNRAVLDRLLPTP